MPLKAVLVGGVRALEVCGVRFHLSAALAFLTEVIQGSDKVADQYMLFVCRLIHLGAMAGALSTLSQPDPHLIMRLNYLSMCVGL